MDGSQQSLPTHVSQAGAERPRAVTGAATAATVLVSLALVHEVLLTVANWRVYLVVHDFLAGRATAAEVLATDSDAWRTWGRSGCRRWYGSRPASRASSGCGGPESTPS